MKKFFIYFSSASVFIACNGGKQYSNEEADTRQHNQPTITSEGDKGTTTADDTTSTINNSAYNTDSASGQGTVFDTSNAKPR
jgi:hypothetical protein